MSGKLIIFEGLDKTGKTTQIKILSKYLERNKIKYIVTREPGGTEIGKRIREILLYKGGDINYLSEYFLFIADRFENIFSKVLKYYKNNYFVIMDRSHFSSFSYQIYPYIKNDEILYEVDKLIGKKIFSIIKPDKILYFTKKEYDKLLYNDVITDSIKNYLQYYKFEKEYYDPAIGNNIIDNNIELRNNKNIDNKLFVSSERKIDKINLNHKKLKYNDKIERRSDHYFYEVLKGYEVSFNYYKDFSKIVEKIYFEDGLEYNSKKIEKIIEFLLK